MKKLILPLIVLIAVALRIAAQSAPSPFVVLGGTNLVNRTLVVNLFAPWSPAMGTDAVVNVYYTTNLAGSAGYMARSNFTLYATIPLNNTTQTVFQIPFQFQAAQGFAITSSSNLVSESFCTNTFPIPASLAGPTNNVMK